MNDEWARGVDGVDKPAVESELWHQLKKLLTQRRNQGEQPPIWRHRLIRVREMCLGIFHRYFDPV